MKLEPRHNGLPFTAEQVEKIGEMLGLSNEYEAYCAACVIASALWFCHLQENSRKEVPEIKVARRRLDRIATTAQHLAKLLDEEPLASKLAVEPGWTRHQDEDGHIDMGKIFDVARQDVELISQILPIISRNAARLSDNDRDLRAAYLLPRASEAGKATPALWLWPKLFQTWEHAGKRAAATPNGPLHRFVSFVHSAAGMGEPNARTFRDAVEAWAADGRSRMSGHPAPWRILDGG